MKKASEIMTKEPACTTQDEKLPDIAMKMLRNDCGEIPVVDDLENLKPVGVITDRDIVARVIAQNKDPKDVRVGECMTSPAITVQQDASIEDCMKAMEKNQIRRLPVVDEEGCLCGMVSQADIARAMPSNKSGKVVKQVSAA